jgi:hypothetical protein
VLVQERLVVAAGQTTGSNTEEDAEAEEGAAVGASSETTDRSVAVAAEADVAAEEDVAEEEAVDTTTTRELETVTNMGITSDITEAIVATRSTAHSLLRVSFNSADNTRWLKDLRRTLKITSARRVCRLNTTRRSHAITMISLTRAVFCDFVCWPRGATEDRISSLPFSRTPGESSSGDKELYRWRELLLQR